MDVVTGLKKEMVGLGEPGVCNRRRQDCGRSFVSRGCRLVRLGGSRVSEVIKSRR